MDQRERERELRRREQLRREQLRQERLRRKYRAVKILLAVTVILFVGVIAEVIVGAHMIRTRNAGQSGAPAESGAVLDGGETETAPAETLPPETLPPETEPPETEPAREIDPTRPMIALTFDDGPLTENTNRLLDILRENDARATFFVVGYALDGNEEVVRRAYDEGHEIGSHTLNHPHLRNLGDAELEQEIGGMRQRIVDITGQETVVIRPPYGETNEQVEAHIHDPIILWSVDTRDWAEKDVDSIFGHIQNDTFDGAIILLHDIHSTTIDAAEVFIPWLREQGYQMVTVSELGQYRDGGLQAGVHYGALRPEETEAPETEAQEAPEAPEA